MDKLNVLALSVLMVLVAFTSQEVKGQKMYGCEAATVWSGGNSVVLEHIDSQTHHKGEFYWFTIKTRNESEITYLDIEFQINHDGEPAFQIQTISKSGIIISTEYTSTFSIYKREWQKKKFCWMKKPATLSIPITSETDFIVITSIMEGFDKNIWLPYNNYIILLNGNYKPKLWQKAIKF